MEPAVTSAATVVKHSPTATNPPKPTPPPPAKPTPAPTSLLNNWKIIGNEADGMQIAIPADWADVSGDIMQDTTTLNSTIGLLSLFAANNPRTGAALLAGKDIQTGAFMAGLITNIELPATDPAAALDVLIDSLQANERVVSDVMSVSIGQMPAAYVDVLGNPVLFADGKAQNLVTRIYLLGRPQATAETALAQPLFLFSTTLPDWERYLPLFTQMAQTIQVHDLNQNVLLSAGRRLAVGELLADVPVNGRLDSGVIDVWTVSVTEPTYVSLTLEPETANLDLTFTLTDPRGQTLVSVDNGFAGDIETAADLFLNQPGIYVVEVADFFDEGGRYRLRLVQSPVPLFSGGGEIVSGQGIQSSIPLNGRQYWTFNGAAGTMISIVLEPDERMDAIFSLYGPDGSQLVVLDEGFSGDAEVLAGYELPVTGPYTILVSGFSGNHGSYTLSLDEGGEATVNFYDAGDLVYGDNKQETLRAHEAHTWFFEGKTGDVVVVNVEPLSPSLDLDVWLLDQNLNRLAAQDAFLQGEAEMLSQTLLADGQYVILVRDFNGITGDYVIRLSAMPLATPEPRGILQFGEPVTGVLDMKQTVVYYFEGRQNETIQIELAPVSPESDFVFTLLGPNGRSRYQIDEESTGRPETVITTLDADGVWGIVVSEFFDEGGEYALTVSRQ
ncbi:MAG: hypothetical protein R6X34_19880 [Chloroflexota bacterium]